jgi:predicted dithiol-disulfide oxidoreductase (DUF899 family)
MQHRVASREEWLAARIDLLKAEKELTRKSDELAQRRQALPWVRVDKDYRFETDAGGASLADLFGGRSQLLVYHFMFGPDYKAGCPSCSMIADGFNGFALHLAHHDAMLWAVSRAPLARLHAYKQRMGWSFPWASSHGSDFNFDFSIAFTETQQQGGGIEYNYRREAGAPSAWQDSAASAKSPVGQHAAMAGTDVATFTRERPGMSAFVREDGAPSITPIPPMGADWTFSGAPISGWTARPKAATKPAVPGGAATTNMTMAEALKAAPWPKPFAAGNVTRPTTIRAATGDQGRR